MPQDKKRLAIAAIFSVTLTHVCCIYWLGWGSAVLGSFAVACVVTGWALCSLRTSHLAEPLATPGFVGASGAASSYRSGGAHPAQQDTTANMCTNAFTIDLEDYFHTEVASRSVSYESWDQMPARIESSVHRLLDLLDQHNTHATVFTLGWIAKKYPALVREVAQRGHEIGCHSFRHRPVFRLDPQEFHADTRMAKEVLEDVIGQPVLGYRAPNFSITPGTEWAFDILGEMGFLYDSSVNPVWHKLYANPNAPRFPYFLTKAKIFEIPIATWRVLGVNLPIGGGAYLRLLPYPYTQLGLAAVRLQDRKAVTLYVHPWEIDQYQPVLLQDWKSRVRQTWGTDTMELKLSRLLASSRFASITEVYSAQFVTPLKVRLGREYESLAQVS